MEKYEVLRHLSRQKQYLKIAIMIISSYIRLSIDDIRAKTVPARESMRKK